MIKLAQTFIFPFIVCLSLLFLSACANKPERPSRDAAEFTTKITENGSKRFILTIANRQGRGVAKQQGRNKGSANTRERGGERQGSGQGRGQGRQGSGENKRNESFPTNASNKVRSNEDQREMVIEILEEKISDSEYCRHGYIELEYSELQTESQFIGECQESASTDDKTKWG